MGFHCFLKLSMLSVYFEESVSTVFRDCSHRSQAVFKHKTNSKRGIWHKPLQPYKLFHIQTYTLRILHSLHCIKIFTPSATFLFTSSCYTSQLHQLCYTSHALLAKLYKVNLLYQLNYTRYTSFDSKCNEHVDASWCAAFEFEHMLFASSGL